MRTIPPAPATKPWRISIDGVATLLAVLAALLIRAAFLRHLPW
ncbi:MAG TPA: hypothetical protein VFA13_07495 [Candidatus Acidoferrum sp.]|nr:hypothetical protein [Candidatus Acidoferrum sp.]